MDIASECKTVAQLLSDAGKEVEWARKEAEAARDSREGQLRNTLAFQRERDELRAVLDATHKLITEGALVGFVPTEGTWAERLYANQAQIHRALNQH